MDTSLLARPVWLFDLDGTLVDSSAGVIRAFHAAQAAFDEAPADSEAIRRAIGYPLEGTVAQLSQIPFERFLPEFRREALSTMHLDSRLLPYAGELLHELAGRRRQMALVTSKRRDNAALIVSHLGVGGFFDTIIGADTAARAKPDPAPVRRALSELAAAPGDAVMVGDTRADIEAAHGAAVPVIAVLSGCEPPAALAAAEERVRDLGVLLDWIVHDRKRANRPGAAGAPGERGRLCVFTRAFCPLCEELVSALRVMGIPFVERDITG